MQVLFRRNIGKLFECSDIVALVCIAMLKRNITKTLELPGIQLAKCPVELMYFSELIWRNANIVFE